MFYKDIHAIFNINYNSTLNLQLVAQYVLMCVQIDILISNESSVTEDI